MSVNKVLIVGGVAAATYYFWPQIAQGLGLPATAAGTGAAPGVTNANTAAAGAAATGASPQQQATAAAGAANATAPAPIAPVVPPTISADNPTDHAGLIALATVADAGGLAAAQTAYPKQAAYLLTTNQWNWYLATATGSQAGIITGPTTAGANAVTAATYLALRTSLGIAQLAQATINQTPPAPIATGTAISNGPLNLQPTITTDNATDHAGLAALASATSTAQLAAAQQGYPKQAGYVLTTDIWNWYNQTAANEIAARALAILGQPPAPAQGVPLLNASALPAGVAAYPASLYLSYRQQQGLI